MYLYDREKQRAFVEMIERAITEGFCVVVMLKLC